MRTVTLAAPNSIIALTLGFVMENGSTNEQVNRQAIIPNSKFAIYLLLYALCQISRLISHIRNLQSAI